MPTAWNVATRARRRSCPAFVPAPNYVAPVARTAPSSLPGVLGLAVGVRAAGGPSRPGVGVQERAAWMAPDHRRFLSKPIPRRPVAAQAYRVVPEPDRKSVV